MHFVLTRIWVKGADRKPLLLYQATRLEGKKREERGKIE